MSAALKVEVAVIGAGVIGLACARNFAIRGKEVLILERAGRIGSGACVILLNLFLSATIVSLRVPFSLSREDECHFKIVLFASKESHIIHCIDLSMDLYFFICFPWQ
jgi:heterodisulfide reductase subunit A-like polyferredoxin